MGYDPTARKWTLVMPVNPAPTAKCDKCGRLRNAFGIYRTFKNEHWCRECIDGNRPA